MNDRLADLRNSRDLAGCGDRELRGLLPYVDEVRLAPREVVAWQGEPCAQYVIVAEGLAEAVSGHGRRVLEAGDTAGWAAMWERSVNEATVRVLTGARLLVMSHAQFRAVRAIAPRPAPAPVPAEAPAVA